ncbi:MAG: hypothetical protein IKD87_09400 [Oscillospiraceae bacterium]|nr:hypothetical protein [Oscillospiraceae bacterium]
MDSQFYDNHQTFPEIDPVTGELRYPETNQYAAPGAQYPSQYPYTQSGNGYAPRQYPSVNGQQYDARNIPNGRYDFGNVPSGNQPYPNQRQGYQQGQPFATPAQNPLPYQNSSQPYQGGDFQTSSPASSYQQALDAARLTAANEENSRLRAELEELRKLREKAEKELEENRSAAAKALSEAESVRKERDTALQQAEAVRIQNETLRKQAEDDLAAVREEAEKRQQETLAQFRMEIAAKDSERQQRLTETRNTIEEQWRQTQAELQRLEEERRRLEEEKSQVADLQLTFAAEKDRLAAERQQLDQDVAATEQIKKQLENEKSDLEIAKQRAEQERSAIEATKLQFDQQKYVLAQNRQLLDQDKALFEQNVQKFNSDRNALKQSAQKLAADRSNIEQFRKQLEDEKNAAAALRRKLAEDRASLDKRMQELGVNRVAFEQSVQQLNEEKNAFEQDLQRFQSDLSEFEKQKAAAEQNKAALAQDREALEQRLQKLNIDRSEFERQREAAEQDKIRLEEERLAAERLRRQLDEDRAALEEARQQSMDELAARERLLAETERQSKEHRANVDENRMREAEGLRAFFEAQRAEAERIRLDLEKEKAELELQKQIQKENAEKELQRLEEERRLLETEKTELSMKMTDLAEQVEAAEVLETAEGSDAADSVPSPFSTLFGEDNEEGNVSAVPETAKIQDADVAAESTEQRSEENVSEQSRAENAGQIPEVKEPESAETVSEETESSASESVPEATEPEAGEVVSAETEPTAAEPAPEEAEPEQPETVYAEAHETAEDTQVPSEDTAGNVPAAGSSETKYMPEVSYIRQETSEEAPEESDSQLNESEQAELPEESFDDLKEKFLSDEDGEGLVFEPLPEITEFISDGESLAGTGAEGILPSELFEPLMPFEISEPADISIAESAEEAAEAESVQENAEPVTQPSEEETAEPIAEPSAEESAEPADDGFGFIDDLPAFEKIDSFEDTVTEEHTEDQSFSDLLNQFSTQLDLGDLAAPTNDTDQFPESGFSIVDLGFDSETPLVTEGFGLDLPEQENEDIATAEGSRPDDSEDAGHEVSDMALPDETETADMRGTEDISETDNTDSITVSYIYTPSAEESVPESLHDETPETDEQPEQDEEPETDSDDDGFSFIVPDDNDTADETDTVPQTESVKVAYDFMADLPEGSALASEYQTPGEEPLPEDTVENETVSAEEQESAPVFFELEDNEPEAAGQDVSPADHEAVELPVEDAVLEEVSEPATELSEDMVNVSVTDGTVKVSEPIKTEEDAEELFDFDSAVDDLATAVLRDNAWLYSMNNLAPAGEEVMKVSDLTSKYYVNEVDCSYPAYKEVSFGFPAGSCTAVISSVPFCAYAFVRALACPEEIGEGTVMLGTRKMTHNDLIYIGSDRLVEKKRKTLDWLMSTIGGSSEQKRAKLLTLLEQAGMTSLADIELESLSYSQRMLVLLVAVSFSNTPVVLINDPQFEIEEVDVNSACAVFKLLADAGKTVLVAGHSPRLMRSVANRVLAIHYGNPVFAGSYRRFIEDNCEALVLFHTDEPEEMEERLSEDERFVIVRDRDIIEIQRAENSTAGENEAIEAAKEAGVPVENLRNGDKGFSIAYKEVFKARPRI